MIKFGVTRIVLLVGIYAIKIPNFLYSHLHFLQGCYSNYSERRYCKMMYGVSNNQYYDKVSPSYFCSWFGLIQIQARCKPIEFDIDDDLIDYFADVSSGDNKKENFGLFNNQIVCLDYA